MTEAGAHGFRVVSSHDIHIGTIVGLRSDEVVMPGGHVATREVVEHHGAVAVLALDAANRLTMVRQYRHALGRRLSELPAGLLDHPGEDAVEAAARELAEETGLAASRWDTLVDVASSPGFTDEVVRVFLARELSTVGRDALGEEEADLVVHTVALDQAVGMALRGQLLNGPTVAGVLAAHTVLAGAGSTRPSDAAWPDRPTAFARRDAR